MRLSCFFDPREERRRERDGQDHQSSNHTRSQESIEKMIVLKVCICRAIISISSLGMVSISYFHLQKVVTVVGKDLDLENAKKEDRIIKRIDRRKSNLLLHTNGGDELDESRTCPICLCEYEDGQRICWSHNKECAHHFHAQCGIAWLAKHTECPICRADYLVEPTDEVGNKENSPHTPPCAQNPITIVEEDEDQSVSSNTTIPQQLIMPTGESVPELETPQSPVDSVEGTTSLQASSETEDE